MPQNQLIQGANQELESLLDKFSKEKDKEVMHKIVPMISKARVLMQAQFPKEFSADKLKGLKPGQKLELGKDAKPLPAILKNNQGGRYFGVYTAKEQIPKENNFPMMLDMTFIDCCRMALRMGMDGIVVNAFTQNITFKKPAVEAFVNDFSPKGKQIKLTLAQFHEVTRRSIELKFLPKFLFEGGKEYFDEICEQKEDLLFNIYNDPYLKAKDIKCPYSKDEFSVMDLNLTEDLMIARLDLPTANIKPGLCIRIYITYVISRDEISYFTIEKEVTGENRKLGRVYSDGKHEIIDDAPEDGAEMQYIMDKLS